MIVLLILSAIAGISVKFTDALGDRQIRSLEVLFGLAYGVLNGIIIAKFPAVAPLWMGLILGNILGRKFNSHGHILSLPATFLTALFLDVPKISIGMAMIFVAAGFADEKLSDYLQSRKSTEKISRYRFIAEIAALIAAIASGVPELFFSLAVFDTGYFIAGQLSHK